MKAPVKLALAVLIFLFCQVNVTGDVVYLKDGGKMEGDVVEEGDFIIIKMGSMRTKLSRDRVAKIEKKKSPIEEYKEKVAALPPNDAQARYELGVWCLERKLASRARAMFEEAIGIDPHHKAARQKLGHMWRGGNWVRRCRECSGKGTVKCPVCKGTGSIRIVCPDCIKGKVACKACNGQGYFICHACNGVGSFLCENCRGSGQVYNGWPWGYGACPVCGGTGRIDCKLCINGRIDCKECKRGKKQCKACNGKGYRYQKCSHCNGEKRLICPRCGGKGFVKVEAAATAPAPEQ